jgi:hypothetical protein
MTKLKSFILATLFVLTLSCAAQSSSSADTIFSFQQKVISGNTYLFVEIKDTVNEHYGWSHLKVYLLDGKDTSFTLEHQLRFYGGDCNLYSATLCEYELNKASLIFYTHSKSIEHFDDTHPHTSYSELKEIYTVQHKGPIVKMSATKGNHNPAVASEVKKRFKDQMDQYQWR